MPFTRHCKAPRCAVGAGWAVGRQGGRLVHRLGSGADVRSRCRAVHGGWGVGRAVARSSGRARSAWRSASDVCAVLIDSRCGPDRIRAIFCPIEANLGPKSRSNLEESGRHSWPAMIPWVGWLWGVCSGRTLEEVFKRACPEYRATIIRNSAHRARSSERESVLPARTFPTNPTLPVPSRSGPARSDRLEICFVANLHTQSTCGMFVTLRALHAHRPKIRRVPAVPHLREAPHVGPPPRTPQPTGCGDPFRCGRSMGDLFRTALAGMRARMPPVGERARAGRPRTAMRGEPQSMGTPPPPSARTDARPCLADSRLSKAAVGLRCLAREERESRGGGGGESRGGGSLEVGQRRGMSSWRGPPEPRASARGRRGAHGMAASRGPAAVAVVCPGRGAAAQAGPGKEGGLNEGMPVDDAAQKRSRHGAPGTPPASSTAPSTDKRGHRLPSLSGAPLSGRSALVLFARGIGATSSRPVLRPIRATPESGRSCPEAHTRPDLGATSSKLVEAPPRSEIGRNDPSLGQTRPTRVQTRLTLVEGS